MKDQLKTMCAVLEKEFKDQVGEINYCFVTTDEIKQLNKDFLSKDDVTDVLSFNNFSDKKKVSGDIALCEDVIRKDADSDDIDFEPYLAEVMLHGSLHLFGLEHDYTEEDLDRVYSIHAELLNEMDLDYRVFNVKSPK